MVIDCSLERPFIRQDWLSARQAYDLVRARNGAAFVVPSITARAHAGLIRTRAERFSFQKPHPEGGKAEWIFKDAYLPKEFWWADGGPELHQNWQSGDFSTHVDGEFEWKAYGVFFDRTDINALLAPEREDDSAEPDGENIETAAPVAELPDDEIKELLRARKSAGLGRNENCKEVGKLAGKRGHRRARELYKTLGFDRGRPPKNAHKK